MEEREYSAKFCKITRGDISVTGVYLQKSFFLSAAGNLFRSWFCRIVKAASWKPLSAIPAAFSSKSNNRQRSPETTTRNMKGPSSNQPGPLGTNQEPFCASFVSLYIPSTPNHLLFNLFHKKTAKAVRIFSLFLPPTSSSLHAALLSDLKGKLISDRASICPLIIS